jgi:hypothetical protein
MDDTISDVRLEEIWEGLSEVFVDKETNYDYIAWKVGNVDINRLEKIFFNDVAAVCAINAMAPIPEVWAGFNPVDLAKCIRQMQSHVQNSMAERIKHKIVVSFYRLRFGGWWKELAAELEKRRNKSQPGRLG